MSENYEVNYTGVIYKNGDKIKFNDENDTEWIGIIRFGLYSTHWLDSDKMIIHKNQHLGWIVYYNIRDITDKSWNEDQKTLVDVISQFDGILIND